MPREIWQKSWSTSGRHGWFLTGIRVQHGRVHETWERDEYTLERGGKSFDYPKRSAEEEFQEPCDIDKSDEETKKGCNKNDEEPCEATETGFRACRAAFLVCHACRAGASTPSS